MWKGGKGEREYHSEIFRIQKTISSKGGEGLSPRMFVKNLIRHDKGNLDVDESSPLLSFSSGSLFFFSLLPFENIVLLFPPPSSSPFPLSPFVFFSLPASPFFSISSSKTRSFHPHFLRDWNSKPRYFVEDRVPRNKIYLLFLVPVIFELRYSPHI